MHLCVCANLLQGEGACIRQLWNYLGMGPGARDEATLVGVVNLLIVLAIMQS